MKMERRETGQNYNEALISLQWYLNHTEQSLLRVELGEFKLNRVAAVCFLISAACSWVRNVAQAGILNCII
jgi:hypothetical protein